MGKRIGFTILVSSCLFFTEAYAKTCSQGQYPVRGHFRQSYYRSNGVHVSKTKVSPYCRNYRDDGPLKQQFPIKMPKRWPHKKEEFKKCSKEKQKKISKILSSLPKILVNVGKLKIYCPSKSETPNNPATSAPEANIISLYNSSFKMDTNRVIIHELAHILWNRLSDQEKKGYYYVSKWKEDPINKTYQTNRKKFSAPDGAYDPEEDFSNNIEYYLADNNKFKSDFPKIYLWIKKLFGGKK